MCYLHYFTSTCGTQDMSLKCLYANGYKLATIFLDFSLWFIETSIYWSRSVADSGFWRTGGELDPSMDPSLVQMNTGTLKNPTHSTLKFYVMFILN